MHIIKWATWSTVQHCIAACQCSSDMKKAVEQLKATVAASTGTSSQAVTDAVTAIQEQLLAASTDTAAAMLEGELGMPSAHDVLKGAMLLEQSLP